MRRFIQVVTTTDNRENADKIAAAVIEQRLAACVQISSCRSIYRWHGRIEQGDEFVCTIKSRLELYPELEKAIRREHGYEVPEIISTEITTGSSDYLAWLDQELRPASKE
jgi:periplasmic divalent cation tolerance protein